MRAGISRLVCAMATHLLLNLQLINGGSQLAQNLICLLVVLELGGNQVRQVAEGLGGVEYLQMSS